MGPGVETQADFTKGAWKRAPVKQPRRVGCLPHTSVHIYKTEKAKTYSHTALETWIHASLFDCGVFQST